jgi:hypothetical protein
MRCDKPGVLTLIAAPDMMLLALTLFVSSRLNATEAGNKSDVGLTSFVFVFGKEATRAPASASKQCIWLLLTYYVSHDTNI